jgi:RNA polymerase sigma factor (sigma-70 family)
MENLLEQAIEHPAIHAIVDTDLPIAVSREDRYDAISELAKVRGPQLYRFILRRVGDANEAADLTQQTLLEALKGVDRFRDESQLNTWLYGIARNLIAHHFCRSPAYRFQWEDAEVLETTADTAVDPEMATSMKHLLQRVEVHMKSLPSEMRDTLSLVAVQALSYEEVAAIQGVPVGTVRSRLSRARSLLMTKLRNEDVEYITMLANCHVLNAK